MTAKYWLFLVLLMTSLVVAIMALVKKSKVVVKYSKEFEESTAKTLEEFKTEIRNLKGSVSQIQEVVHVRKSKSQ